MNGYNVIGFASANFGLGIAARNTVRLLLDKGHPVSIADLRLDDGRSGQDRSFDRLLHAGSAPLPYSINLFHCNPPHIEALLKAAPAWLVKERCLNVCVPYWEQTLLPEPWIAPLSAMDIVLCPSRFVELAVAGAVAGPLPHVRHFPQTTFLPQKRQPPGRANFGLPEDGVLFIQSFEMGSDCSRKNPWAALDAFNAAFPSRERAYLIVKLQNSSPGFEPMQKRLQEYAAANDRIVIVDRSLGYGDVLSLYESCDCFVSLHRSEGLGLGPLEAMFLKKPVIATGWSGNMDFMNEDNSCLVKYRMAPVDSPVYQKLCLGLPIAWADPSIEEAAGWMRRLFENAGLRERIGARAQQDMLKRQEECLKNDVFEKVGEMLERKLYRILKKEAIGSNYRPGQHKDQSEFFSGISTLLKQNEIEKAMDLYNKERDSFKETSEILRIDEIISKICSMKKNNGCKDSHL